MEILEVESVNILSDSVYDVAIYIFLYEQERAAFAMIGYEIGMLSFIILML